MNRVDTRRRALLGVLGAVGLHWGLPRAQAAQGHPSARVPSAGPPLPELTAPPSDAPTARYERSLILIELKGGNDALNTVVPYAHPLYRQLRPRLGIHPDALLALDHRAALHPALHALWPLWQGGEMSVIESVGAPLANASHFRSAQVWDTASGPAEYVNDGWLARTLERHPPSSAFDAAAVMLDSAEAGPLARGASALPAAPLPCVQYRPSACGNARLRAASDTAPVSLETAVRHWAGRAPVMRLTLDGFDTHANQAARHTALLTRLADTIVTLRRALVAQDRWTSTLILTTSEFGRQPRENAAGGTEHGTAAAHFAIGGAVRGGLLGLPPALHALDADGQLPVGPDFRDMYATVLRQWWQVDPAPILGGRFASLPFLTG